MVVPGCPWLSSMVTGCPFPDSCRSQSLSQDSLTAGFHGFGRLFAPYAEALGLELRLQEPNELRGSPATKEGPGELVGSVCWDSG